MDSYIIDFYVFVFFFQAEDGIRDRSPSRGLGDVYKRQYEANATAFEASKSMASKGLQIGK